MTGDTRGKQSEREMNEERDTYAKRLNAEERERESCHEMRQRVKKLPFQNHNRQNISTGHILYSK